MPAGDHVGVESLPGMPGHAPQARAVAIDRVDLHVAVAIGHERETCPVGRERRQEVVDRLGAAGGLVHLALVDVGDVDVRIAAAVRRVGDGPPVGRPARVDRQRPVHRDAPLRLAVVVGDVDLLDAALLDGAACLLAVAIAGKRELGARHALQASAVPCAVRRRWCGQTARGLLAAAVYSLAHTLRCVVDVEQARLDGQARRVLPHRADQHDVGAEFLPLRERHRLHRCGRRDRRIAGPRNQVVLALESQVVPEHLADRVARPTSGQASRR